MKNRQRVSCTVWHCLKIAWNFSLKTTETASSATRGQKSAAEHFAKKIRFELAIWRDLSPKTPTFWWLNNDELLKAQGWRKLIFILVLTIQIWLSDKRKMWLLRIPWIVYFSELHTTQFIPSQSFPKSSQRGSRQIQLVDDESRCSSSSSQRNNFS